MITYEPLNRFAFYFPDKPGFLRNLFIILLIHNLFWSHFSYKINKNFSFFLFSFFIFFSFPFYFLYLIPCIERNKLILSFSNILEYSRISALLQHLINLNFQTEDLFVYFTVAFFPSIYTLITFSVPKKAPEYYFSCQKTSGEFRRKRLRNTRKKTVKGIFGIFQIILPRVFLQFVSSPTFLDSHDET